MKIDKVENCRFITGVQGKIVLAKDNFPLFTIILNGDEKIYCKDYSLLHILDVTFRNSNDGKLYLGDVKLYDNVIDAGFTYTYIPNRLNIVNIIVKCRPNEYGAYFDVIVKGDNK